MKTLIIIFVSVGCAPCDSIKREIETRPLSGVTVVIEDIRDRPDLAEKLEIRSTPTLIAARDGRELARKIGYTSRQDLDKWLERARR